MWATAGRSFIVTVLVGAAKASAGVSARTRAPIKVLRNMIVSFRQPERKEFPLRLRKGYAARFEPCLNGNWRHCADCVSFTFRRSGGLFPAGARAPRPLRAC